MTTARERLEGIAEQLRSGGSPEPISVRAFLYWFGAQRRGSNVVWDIRRSLRSAGLTTRPDFESAWMDGMIEFALAEEPGPHAAEENDNGNAANADSSEPTDSVGAILADPTYRISKLELRLDTLSAVSSYRESR